MWWENDNHLTIRNNTLYVHDRPALSLAEEYGTPLYVYNSARIRSKYRLLKDALQQSGMQSAHRIYYAMKANRYSGILGTIRELEAGIDATSCGEVSLAVDNSFAYDSIIFTGTSLSNRDLKWLSTTSVIINFDSVSSIRRFPSQIGRKVGFRINTGVGIGRSPAISTGGSKSGGLPVKFGLSGEALFNAVGVALKKGFEIYCVHHHLGSDWLGNRTNKYFEALANLLEITKELHSQFKVQVHMLDLGGGFGVPHSEDETEFPVFDFFKEIAKYIDKSGLEFGTVAIEPGNYLVGDAGLLLVEVNTVEEKKGHIFVGVDAGLNVFNPPSLYGFYHEIVNCNNCTDNKPIKATVAGNICETVDLFAVDRELPRVHEGDILAILNAGAYGSVMASEYNCRPMAKEIMI